MACCKCWGLHLLMMISMHHEGVTPVSIGHAPPEQSVEQDGARVHADLAGGGERKVLWHLVDVHAWPRQQARRLCCLAVRQKGERQHQHRSMHALKKRHGVGRRAAGAPKQPCRPLRCCCAASSCCAVVSCTASTPNVQA